MTIELVKQTSVLWAVFDGQCIVKESLTEEGVADYILADKRATVLDMIKQYKPRLSWDEALFLSGRLLCCDCSAVVDHYNPKWPIERQRCKLCLGR